MTRERWERLAPLIDAILDQPLDQRPAYLAKISDGDVALEEELRRFVSAYGEQENDQRSTPMFEAAEQARSALMFSGALEAAVDLRTQLQASLGASYVIEGEIRGGGMARVFVAEEPGLERKVVIKMLPPEMSEGVSAERFAREIKLAASLQQANIVPVLAAGTAAGVPYYTMPFVEGRSLRERLLRDGALPVSEAIGILRDVARALAFAHGRGVIHRDIKPGNILLSHHTAVVTDFGIAKALGAAREQPNGGATHHSPARTGTFGTPAYMAPEQASGDPNLDHRADIYSFGCVAYELLTGKPPFVRTAPKQVIRAHQYERPRAVTELRANVPVAIARLVATCMEKDPSRRPQSADDVLLTLDAATNQPAAHPRSRRVKFALSTVVLVAAAALAYYGLVVPASEPLDLAAVPFRLVMGDTSIEYRSDGVSDEILNGLTKVPGLRIVGRTEAFRFKDRRAIDTLDIRTVERALGARLLVTGTYGEAKGHLIISAQLNDSMSRGELWSRSFPGSSSDRGLITDEIVRQIAETLRVRFGRRVGTPHNLSTPGTTNAEAQDRYQIGQDQLRSRGSGIANAIQSFQSAIELDSNFARAHAALAMALSFGPFFFDDTPPLPLIERSKTEARRALELDSTLADAYVALGAAHAHVGEWEQASAYIHHAIKLEPNNSSARQMLARHLVLRGRAAEAIEQFERARDVERTSPLISSWLAYAFFLDGRPDSARAESERAKQVGPALLGVANLGALLNLGLGRNDAARRFMIALNSPGMTNAPYVFAKLGDTDAANRLIHDWEARTPRPWFTDVAKASVLLATGDSDGALSALERSSQETGALWVFYIPVSDPAFDPVRKSARFNALLRQANIDLRVVTNPRRGQ